MHSKTLRSLGLIAAALWASTGGLHAGEADLKIPGLEQVKFDGLGGLSGLTLMYLGIAMCAVGAVFGLVQYWQTKRLPVHESMSSVSHTIWETCKEYLFQQGKFLAILWVLIASCIFFYFRVLEHKEYGDITVILLASILGMLGSYGVAWFGIRINTTANSRTAFSALKGNPLRTLSIPLQSGMSVGLLLVSVELFFMISILVFLPKELVGPCFIGFAIGESLGASVLRICGGIFTKIADIGSDLMKIVFKLPEDDPKNPGVIADCTGDNAGDSVGPTADGFETYGVTGVALIAFLALALAANQPVCATLIIWLFTMRALMIATSLASYFINDSVCRARYGSQKDFDFEAPLTQLVWITSAISIFVTFIASYVLLAHQTGLHPDLWWVLAAIISCGTAAGALIPEFSKIFTSTNSQHVKEITTCSKRGGASLNILSGFVAGNFSAFWTGLVILSLMFTSCLFAMYQGSPIVALMPDALKFAAPIFAFGLVAFGFLSMGPVTIAVDSFGPVTDNAQSIYELSQIESRKNIRAEIEEQFGFEPDFENAKYQLEKGDGAGNTFKATAKPVLIGTAVVGATTMVFGIIILLDNIGKAADPSFSIVSKLSLVLPEMILGLLMGGSVIYWFTGASCQAVVTGAYRAVVYIQDTHQARFRHRVGKGQQGSRPHLHRLCAERNVEHLHRDFLPRAVAGVFQSVFLHRLSHRHRVLRIVPGDLHGQRRRRVGQRQENRRSGVAAKRHRPARRHRRRRHRGRSVQGHLVRGVEPGDQVHHALRPARGGNRRDDAEPEFEEHHRRRPVCRRAGFCPSLVLRHEGSRSEGGNAGATG